MIVENLERLICGVFELASRRDAATKKLRELVVLGAFWSLGLGKTRLFAGEV